MKEVRRLSPAFHEHKEINVSWNKSALGQTNRHSGWAPIQSDPGLVHTHLSTVDTATISEDFCRNIRTNCTQPCRQIR